MAGLQPWVLTISPRVISFQFLLDICRGTLLVDILFGTERMVSEYYSSASDQTFEDGGVWRYIEEGSAPLVSPSKNALSVILGPSVPP